jgi:phage terminase small subunit
MAGRGRTRKPAAVAADERNGVAVIAPNTKLSVAVPTPPTGLLATTKQQWAEFWASDIAVLLQYSDLAAVHRLFELRDEYERCYREVRKTKTTRIPAKYNREGDVVEEADEIRHSGRIGLGSTGHFTVSPEAKLMQGLAAEIRQIEDRLGLNTRSRAGLAALVLPTGGGGGEPPPGAAGSEDHTVDGDSNVIDQL